VACPDKGGRSGGHKPHAELVVFYLARYADDHQLITFLIQYVTTPQLNRLSVLKGFVKAL
jgi:hypothetical protein